MLVADALGPGVVPDADSIRIGRRQIRDLEVGAPGAAHASEHPCDALADHGARRVQGLCEQADVQRVLAMSVVDVTRDSSDAVLSLISRPLEREVLLPAGHQGRGRHGQRRAGSRTCAGSHHRSDQAHQEREPKGCHRRSSGDYGAAALTAASTSAGSRRFSGLSIDRKSTRLNSSHVAISYAVFCLKKKNNRTCWPLLSSMRSRFAARSSLQPPSIVDRTRTRLNSSHVSTSYPVFFLTHQPQLNALE